MTNQKAGRNDPCPCGSGKKFKQCCALNPNPIQNTSRQSLQAAWNFFRQGFIDDAEKIGREVLDRDARAADAWHLLGSIALQQGQTAEAADYSRRAIRLNGRNPEYFSNLGLACHEQGALDEAITQYRHAIALDSRYANAHYNLHAALIDSSNLNPAIDALKQALKLNPRDHEARFMLGMLLDYSGAAEDAAACLEGLDRISSLYRARLDAWHYLKSSCKPLPPVTGSAIQTFRHAFSQANPEGLVLEFGVRFGNSIRMLAEIAKQPVHGFDSFEGLPDVWHHEPKGSYTTNGVIPAVPDNVSLHVGWFDETLPKFLESYPGPVRFVNVDCDIYSSTRTVLELLAPRIVQGSVMVFDEYIANAHWREDEFKAFQEAVRQYGWSYEYISFSFFTKQVAVRITGV
ncbi:TPR repeat-containing protein YrrB [Methylophilaceae bacterium]|nr:TPR repeat-containing protein YrrB [Methylophilaceae bacterium]